MTDIYDFAAADTAVMTVKHPATDEPFLFDGKPALITMYGPGSPRAAEWEARRNSRVMALAKANNGKIELSAKEQTWQRIEKLVMMTVSIENLPCKAAEGKTGDDLARAIYSDRQIGFVADQADTFQGGWAPFMPASATS